jgi:hypothetical protein
MRSKSLLGILLGLICALFASAPVAQAQAPTNTVILPWDHIWKYEQILTNLPASWRTTNYDDSAWAEGISVFGFPNDEALPTGPVINWGLSTNNGTHFTITHYFRTTFEFTNNTTNLVMVLSNVLDDGAVFYLNGREIQRVGIPSGTVTYQTLASGRDEIINRGFDIIYFAPTNLMRTNVLAAELHQSSAANSTDAIFGSSLSYHYGTRPGITNQPKNQVVACAGAPATFSLSATGFPPSTLVYLWYTNGVRMTNEAGPLLTIDRTTLAMNGLRVHAIVSNAVGTATSTNAFLTVYPDQCGPRILLAEVRDFAGREREIELTIDENLTTRSTNDYRVIGLSNLPPIRVTNIVGGANRVILTTDTALSRSNRYVLIANGVKDPLNNFIAPNTAIPVSFKVPTTIFDPGSGWQANPSERGDTISINWTNLNYIDDPFHPTNPNFNWFSGFGVFHQDPVTNNPPVNYCVPKGSAISLGARTYYFRKKFVLSTNFFSTNVLNAMLNSRVELQLPAMIDDGAVFYLNGVEVLRVRMPLNVPIFYSTLPTAIGEFACTTNAVDVDGSVLRLGTNIFAVEVHQGNDPGIVDVDVLFDTGLTIGVPDGPVLRPAPRPRINFVRQGGNITFSWPTNGLGTNDGYILESTDIITTNLWREVQPAMSNPHTVPANTAGRFYRLRWHGD